MLYGVDMNDLADVAGRHAPSTFLPRWVEQLVVSHAHQELACFRRSDHFFRFAGIEGERFFDVDMRARREALQHKWSMALRRRRDMNDVWLRCRQHACDVVECHVDAEAYGGLAGELPVLIADRHNRHCGRPAELLKMGVGDLAATNQRNAQTMTGPVR